eukprot:2522730-Karenia_brevis.AAC.1
MTPSPVPCPFVPHSPNPFPFAPRSSDLPSPFSPELLAELRFLGGGRVAQMKPRKAPEADCACWAI